MSRRMFSTSGYGKYKLIKIYKIQFVDEGICGDVYKQEGIKYYSLTCSFESVDKTQTHYFKYDNVSLLLTEEELNKLINEYFYYDKNNNKIYFKEKSKTTN